MSVNLAARLMAHCSAAPMDRAKGYVCDRYAIGALIWPIRGACDCRSGFGRSVVPKLLLEVPFACAYLPEVSTWVCSAEVVENKAVYGTLLYSNLIVIFLPHYRRLCSYFS